MAPEVCEDRAPRLGDRLADAGLSDAQIDAVLGVVDTESNRRAFHQSAQVLRWIGERLKAHSSHSAAVAAALGLHGGESLSQLGERLSVSKQAVHAAAARVAPAFADVAEISPAARGHLRAADTIRRRRAQTTSP